MGSMIGPQNAANASLFWKRGMDLKQLDWVACVCDFAYVTTTTTTPYVILLMYSFEINLAELALVTYYKFCM